jgi:hypothetical protein
MSVEVFTAYGLPGLILGAIVWLAHTLIKRGVRVKIEAEIPPRG